MFQILPLAQIIGEVEATTGSRKFEIPLQNSGFVNLMNEVKFMNCVLDDHSLKCLKNLGGTQSRLTSSMPSDSEGTGFEDEERLRNIWEYLRGQSFLKMSYEDFLQSYGVRSKTVNSKRPELLRIIKDWQLPTNTVDPLSGNVSTAVSWSISESADKDRFLKNLDSLLFFCCKA